MNKSIIVDILGLTSLALLLINQLFWGNHPGMRLILLAIMIACIVYKYKTRG
jgi:hypothetical protein